MLNEPLSTSLVHNIQLLVWQEGRLLSASVESPASGACLPNILDTTVNYHCTLIR